MGSIAIDHMQRTEALVERVGERFETMHGAFRLVDTGQQLARQPRCAVRGEVSREGKLVACTNRCRCRSMDAAARYRESHEALRVRRAPEHGVVV